VLNTLVGAATSFVSRVFARAHQPVFNITYIWVSAPNTWECQRTSHTVELTDFMPHYLSKAEAQFTNKTSHLTPHLLQNAFYLHPESAFCCTLGVSGIAITQYF